PVLGELSGSVGVELGSYDMIDIDAAVNVPLGKTLAVRVAAQVVDREGYLSDGSMDQRTKSGRIRALWEPSQDASLLLNADYAHNGGQGSGAVLLPVQGGNPYRSMTDQPLVYPWAFGTGTLPYTTPGVDRMVDGTTWGLSAEANFNLGPATLTIIPSYREQDQAVVSYSTTFRFAEVLHGEQTTLEARLGNESPVLSWVIGGYYFSGKDDVQVYPSQGNFTSAVFYYDSVEAKAAFAQATLTLAKGVRAIGGIRYTNEKIGLQYQAGAGAFPLVPFVPSGTLQTVPSSTLNKTTYKVGFELDLAEQSMLYGTLSTGFKGGGFNASTACSTGAFRPEDVKAFELGLRNRFFSNTLQVNVEAFHWTYSDQHVGLQQIDRCGLQARSTLNVGKSTIKGVNADIVWRATPADTFNVAVEYANGKYDEFAFLNFGVGNYATATGTRCRATAATAGNFNIDCSGLEIARLPKFSGRASYQHQFDLGNGGTLRAGAAARFASGSWLDVVYGPQGRVPAYQVLDADLTYSPEGGRFSVSLFVQNITNEVVYTGGLAISGAAGLIPVGRQGAGTRYYSATVAPPRMFGIRGRANF
ncbi:MAG TPA: TonB-dependent receptor, partial [Sphingomicrobium sp.]